MILSKRYLNEQVQKGIIKEELYHGYFSQKRNNSTEYDVFISYSRNDHNFANKIVQLLEKCGYTAYIDYNDKRLDGNATEETAKLIIEEMKKCKALLYLYSPSSSVSKWCPWEVGVFSGMKNLKCANLPLLESYGDSFKKQEYLELYPYIEYDKIQDKEIFDFWVCESDNKYTSLRNWINGGKLSIHK